MSFSDAFNDNNPAAPKSRKTLCPLFTQDNTIAVYTVIAILRQMKNELGLEAMMEYMAEYLRVIEDNNPRLKRSVCKVLQLMSVEKMYNDAIKDK